jgi:hypothetical protein
MRETKNYAKGLITTTTNGEDWSFQRFVKGNDRSRMYGSMHVPTSESLRLGIITEKYYNTMLKSYSQLMADQELGAKHVNVMGGKAYYSASDINRQIVSPWGDVHPSRDRPLIIGCDFNFSPAPLVWMVGQVGPNLYAPDGRLYSEMIHWFGELSGKEMSTQAMTTRMLAQYPDYFYRIFGDVSGGVGTTSNAGVTDYDQMSAVLAEAGALFTIDYFQADEEESRSNPRVRTRVENMNSMLCNAVGEVRLTYNPVACPLFEGDLKMVGWKPVTSSGRGKLDDAGDNQRTHATDGAGYAIMKLFPPQRRAALVQSIESTIRPDYALIDRR